MDRIILREPIMIEVDGAVLDLTFTQSQGIPPHDDVWIAEVYDEQEDAFWDIDPPPMGATLGECIDAVVREAKR